MTDDTQKQVAETVVRYDIEQQDSYMGSAFMRVDAFGDWVRFTDYEALAARLAEVEAERNMRHREMLAADALMEKHKRRAEAAEARVTELEALLAAYQDQTMPDLTAVYIAGGMDRRDEVARLSDFLSDFASAKIDALRYSPPYGSSPEDEPDPVVDAETVWAWQADAKTALAPQPTATKETKSV